MTIETILPKYRAALEALAACNDAAVPDEAEAARLTTELREHQGALLALGADPSLLRAPGVGGPTTQDGPGPFRPTK